MLSKRILNLFLVGSLAILAYILIDWQFISGYVTSKMVILFSVYSLAASFLIGTKLMKVPPALKTGFDKFHAWYHLFALLVITMGLMAVNAKQEGEIDRKRYQAEWDSRTYCLKLLPPADYNNTRLGNLEVLINQKPALYPKLDKQGNFISFSTVPAMKNKKVLLEFIYRDDQRNTYTINDSLVLTSIPDTLQINH